MSRVILILIGQFLYTGYAMACSCRPIDTEIGKFPRYDIALDIVLFVLFFALWHFSLFVLRKLIPRMNRLVFSFLGFMALIPTAGLSYKLQSLDPYERFYLFKTIQPFDPFKCRCDRFIYQFGPNYLHLALSILFILLLDRLIYVCFLKRRNENF